MYDILQLNEMLLTQLKQIAEERKIKGWRKFNKKDLIDQILDSQSEDSEEEEEEAQDSTLVSLPSTERLYCVWTVPGLVLEKDYHHRFVS